MTMKDIFFGLMRACTNLVSGIGSAAVEVLRQGDLQNREESDLDRAVRESDEYFFRDSPTGDGHHDLDPNHVRDSC
tara:strand:+ start:781 stop:1008 length:228 start_codon:yes stop_codon:yes gene_type:complete